MRPHAGKIIGLQFQAHRKGLSALLSSPLLSALHLVGDAKLVLHVMPHFMGDYIGLGGVSRRVKTPLQFLEELEIQVNVLVARAIERTNRRLRIATSGFGLARKEHQFGLLIGTS